MTSHHGQMVLGEPCNLGAEPDEACLKARFVHYPDCQQLILWLPRFGRQYQDLRIVDTATGAVVLEFAVADRLQGSIQLLLDTTVLPTGNYQLVVTHAQGWQHQLDLRKLPAGVAPPTPPPAPTQSTGPIRYRDGTGRPLPDQDLELRAKVQQEIAARFLRHLRYEDYGRTGYVVYVEGEIQLKFAYELGGARCVAWVEVPAAAAWEQATGVPLARREDILDFTATHLRAQQGPSCRVEVRAESIVLLR